jgi:hypothetical protein
MASKKVPCGAEVRLHAFSVSDQMVVIGQIHPLPALTVGKGAPVPIRQNDSFKISFADYVVTKDYKYIQAVAARRV